MITAEAARQMMLRYWNSCCLIHGPYAEAYWAWKNEWLDECSSYIRNRAKEQVTWLGHDDEETKT